MANFKQLTREDGTRIWVNLGHVTVIIGAPDGSLIWIVGEDSDIKLKEAPHEIVAPAV